MQWRRRVVNGLVRMGSIIIVLWERIRIQEIVRVYIGRLVSVNGQIGWGNTASPIVSVFETYRGYQIDRSTFGN